ncbi:MAG: dihydrolipoyl dehydrogenase [Burkholderiales bacterium]
MGRRLDVAIVGAGTAGLSALAVVRRHTEDFVLINDGPYGTTCARVGCMPSKALIEVVKALRRLREFDRFGIGLPVPGRLDGAAVLRHVRRMRDDYVRGVLKLTADLGDRSIAGRARFLAPDALEVNGDRIEAQRIVVATGSRPVVPAAWIPLGAHVLTTDDLFEQSEFPRRVAVVGLGAVGAEMAQALARLGVEVSAFAAGGRVAGLTDPEVSASAIAMLAGEMEVHAGARADVEACGAHLMVRAGAVAVEVDKVLVAMGRTPNLSDLGLENLGIVPDERGRLPVDPRTLRLPGLPVYIAGDASGRAKILHEAADEGWIAGHNATRVHDHCFERRTPLAIVFTDPEIAVVGKRFSELAADETILGEADLEGQGRLRMSGRDFGRIRIYAQRETGLLLGAELVAAGGEHLAHLLALAIQQRQTVVDLLRIPFYHPTVEEALRTALRDAARKLPGEAGPDLAYCERLPAAGLA